MVELDGLRGFAALSVVLSHLPNRAAELARSDFGACGVLIFFVLSGFLMGHLYLQRRLTPDRARKFVVSRVARIVPLYYAVVILAFLASPWLGEAFTYQMDWTQFARLLSFTGSLSVFWSVGPEFQFYFFFLCVWLIPSMSGGLRWLSVAALAAVIGVSYATSPYSPGVLFFSKLHIFMAGVGVALLRVALVKRGLLNDKRVRFLQALSLLAIAVLLVPLEQMLLDVFPWQDVAEESKWYYSDLPRTAMAALIVLSFSFSTAPAHALLGHRFVREIGQASFAIYLLHVPMIDLFEHYAIFALVSPWLSGLLCTAAVVAVAMLVNRTFEAPARQWITRRFAPADGAPTYASSRGRP
jgi:peptidoglycan/LPS O-acetylase OafA/YrhL